ncbi:MAG: hypothetical protein WBZ36_17885 [Candidatus Nitrosopolaris sp.]
MSIPLGIGATAVVFALGFMASNQQTFAANLCGSGLGCGGAASATLHHSPTSSVERFLTSL